MRRHVLIQLSIDKVFEFLRKWSFSSVVFLGQVEADDISAVFLEQSREVLLRAQTSLVFDLVDDNIGLGSQ